MAVELNRIKNHATRLGFDICGAVEASKIEGSEVFWRSYTDKRLNGGMEWMERNQPLRCDVRLLLEGARTVVVCGMAHPVEVGSDLVARFAQSVDYHYILKEQLALLLEAISVDVGRQVQCVPFVDSVPVAERYWAQKAGLGWIGRNGMLINRELGSFFMLAGMVIDEEVLNYSEPSGFNGCGNCSRCIRACPTEAILEGGVVDSRSCLSYLTIEHRGSFSKEQQLLIDRAKEKGCNTVFGCDKCQDVCPWNKRMLLNLSAAENLRRKEIFKATNFVFDKETILNMSLGAFRKQYGSTPLMRAGLRSLCRNFMG